MSNTCGKRRPAGFSVVELLVAMALSLLLLAGVGTMFSSSRQTYEANDRLARVEENGRFALDSIVRDLRAAGYVGCSKLSQYTNTLRNAGTGMWNFMRGTEGFDATGTNVWSPALDATMVPSAASGSDVLVVRVPAPGMPALRLTAAMATGKDVIQVPKYPTGAIGAFKKNQILMISDCERRAVFEVTDYDPQAGTIKHEISAATLGSPGNLTDDLLHPYNKTASTIGLLSIVYYVRANANGGTSLWRKIGNANAEELVEGVEQLQLRFGEDTNGDRIGDAYVTAGAVTNFENIVSVTIGLLVRSPEPYGLATAVSYDVLDQTVNTNDRYLRRVFATTAAVRNTAL